MSLNTLMKHLIIRDNDIQRGDSNKLLAHGVRLILDPALKVSWFEDTLNPGGLCQALAVAHVADGHLTRVDVAEDIPTTELGRVATAARVILQSPHIAASSIACGAHPGCRLFGISAYAHEYAISAALADLSHPVTHTRRESAPRVAGEERAA